MYHADHPGIPYHIIASSTSQHCDATSLPPVHTRDRQEQAVQTCQAQSNQLRHLSYILSLWPHHITSHHITSKRNHPIRSAFPHQTRPDTTGHQTPRRGALRVLAHVGDDLVESVLHAIRQVVRGLAHGVSSEGKHLADVLEGRLVSLAGLTGLSTAHKRLGHSRGE